MTTLIILCISRNLSRTFDRDLRHKPLYSVPSRELTSRSTGNPESPHYGPRKDTRRVGSPRSPLVSTPTLSRVRVGTPPHLSLRPVRVGWRRGAVPTDERRGSGEDGDVRVDRGTCVLSTTGVSFVNPPYPCSGAYGRSPPVKTL